MRSAGDPTLTFVVKVDQLAILDGLRDAPRPRSQEWIDRGTDGSLMNMSVEMLLRTLGNDRPSPSVLRLRERAGLRLTFASTEDREAFAGRFKGRA